MRNRFLVLLYALCVLCLSCPSFSHAAEATLDLRSVIEFALGA